MLSRLPLVPESAAHHALRQNAANMQVLHRRGSPCRADQGARGSPMTSPAATLRRHDQRGAVDDDDDRPPVPAHASALAAVSLNMLEQPRRMDQRPGRHRVGSPQCGSTLGASLPDEAEPSQSQMHWTGWRRATSPWTRSLTCSAGLTGPRARLRRRPTWKRLHGNSKTGPAPPGSFIESHQSLVARHKDQRRLLGVVERRLQGGRTPDVSLGAG